MTTLELIKSEVEINASKLITGDVVLYLDAVNSQVWTITEIFEGGFEAIEFETKETKDFYFNELQYGWKVSIKTKQRIQANALYQSRK